MELPQGPKRRPTPDKRILLIGKEANTREIVTGVLRGDMGTLHGTSRSRVRHSIRNPASASAR
jgi:hypothetical protein